MKLEMGCRTATTLLGKWRQKDQEFKLTLAKDPVQREPGLHKTFKSKSKTKHVTLTLVNLGFIIYELGNN